MAQVTVNIESLTDQSTRATLTVELVGEPGTLLANRVRLTYQGEAKMPDGRSANPPSLSATVAAIPSWTATDKAEFIRLIALAAGDWKSVLETRWA